MSKIRDDAATRLAHGSAHDAEHHQAHRRRAVTDLLFHGRQPRKIFGWAAAFIVLLLLAVAATYLFTDFRWADLSRAIDWARITRTIDRLNPAAVIPLMAVLPVFGFPVSVVYLIAGARFGPVWGGVVVALVTAVHLLLSYGIARSVLRRPLGRFIGKRHLHLPEIPDDEHAMVALVVALVPGLPYIVRIYLLALTDIRLRAYFGVFLAVCVLRSYATILMGDLSSEPSGSRLMILLGVDGLKVLICAGVIWWLRAHHRKYHGAAAAGPKIDAGH